MDRRGGKGVGEVGGRLLALCAAILFASGVASAQGVEETATFGRDDASFRLVVRGAVDVDIITPILERFVGALPDLRVTFESWNTNDLFEQALAECRDGKPAADLLFSSGVDQLVKLVNDGCAQPHHSVLASALPRDANWRDELFGLTEEPAVIVYNRDLVAASDAPRSRFDLIDLLRSTDRGYDGRVATYDIENSGIGYLFAFADSEQATTYGSLIEAFARSGAVATCCSAEIIQAVAEGRYLIAYNVLGSYALARAAQDRRIAVVAPEDYTLILRRAAMIPTGAENPTAAGLLIDFLLSPDGRAALADAHLLSPFGQEGGADEPDLASFRPIPLSPRLLLGLDAQKRASFLARWRATFTPLGVP